MKIKNLIKLYFTLIIIFSVNVIFSQQTYYFFTPQNTNDQVIDFFNKKQFSILKQQTKIIPDKSYPTEAEYAYYKAYSAYMLHNDDAISLLLDYLDNYPLHVYTNKAKFFIGNNYFWKKNYKKSIEYYNEVDIDNMVDSLVAELFFKRGYSYFTTEQYNEALVDLSNVMRYDTWYTPFAQYFIAYINYANGNYHVSLKEFKKIPQYTDDAALLNITDYHILFLEYLTNQVDSVIVHGEKMLPNALVTFLPDIHRMLAQAYWTKNELNLAKEHLVSYFQLVPGKVTREDNYMLGYLYYSTGDYKSAIQYLTKVMTIKDSIYQSAAYHLGNAYLKTDQKIFAQKAFYDAYSLDFDSLIREDALFNYAKLSYELDYDPYNLAINALQKYIEEYPQSIRKNEAQELMLNLLMISNNYPRVIEIIEQMPRKNITIENMYQKACLNQALLDFKDRQYNRSISYLNKAFNYGTDRTLKAKALFWKGEAYFALAKYDSALITFQTFVNYSPAKNLPEYNKGFYNLGYSYLMTEKYSLAVDAFNNFISLADNEPTHIKYDAYLRYADALFLTKKIDEAAKMYKKVIDEYPKQADYAYLSYAKILGIKGQLKEKINYLDLLIINFPNSPYIPEALYEKALSQELIDETNAIKTYHEVYTKYPQHPLANKAMLKEALILRNQKEYDKAIQVLEELIIKYKNSESERDAWIALRETYTDADRINEFFAFAQKYGKSVSADEQEELIYTSAENKFMSNDYQSAITAFDQYLTKFPDGAYSIHAHFYRGEANYALGNFENALQDYLYVINAQNSRFTESSLLKAARIYYNRNEYEACIPLYEQLLTIAQVKMNRIEAMRNLLKAYELTNNYNKS
jgi:TolA-binding protein